MEPIVGKPGYLTTEFWLSVVGVLSTLLIAWRGDDFGLAANAQSVAVIAPSILAGLYALGRSVLKGQTHAAIAAQNSAAAVSGVQLRSDDPTG